MIYVNVKVKPGKLLEKHIGKNHYDLGLCKESLDTKSTNQKKILIKWTSSKLKISALQNTQF